MIDYLMRFPKDVMKCRSLILMCSPDPLVMLPTSSRAVTATQRHTYTKASGHPTEQWSNPCASSLPSMVLDIRPFINFLARVHRPDHTSWRMK